MERWVGLDEIEFPSYEISSHGRVRNIDTRKILSTSINQAGVVRVNLRNSEGKYLQFSVARLVAESFDIECRGPKFNTITHLDLDRTNLRVDNLVWRPRWFAIKYHKQSEQRMYGPKSLVRIKRTGEVFENPRAAARKYGLLEMDVWFSACNQDSTAFPSGFWFELVD